jgi:hypothetical protein
MEMPLSSQEHLMIASKTRLMNISVAGRTFQMDKDRCFQPSCANDRGWMFHLAGDHWPVERDDNHIEGSWPRSGTLVVSPVQHNSTWACRFQQQKKRKAIECTFQHLLVISRLFTPWPDRTLHLRFHHLHCPSAARPVPFAGKFPIGLDELGKEGKRPQRTRRRTCWSGEAANVAN